MCINLESLQLACCMRLKLASAPFYRANWEMKHFVQGYMAGGGGWGGVGSTRRLAVWLSRVRTPMHAAAQTAASLEQVSYWLKIVTSWDLRSTAGALHVWVLPTTSKNRCQAQLPIHLKANFATAKQPPGFFEDPLGNPKSEPREAATRNTSQSPLLSILTALERIGANTSQHNITSSHHQFDLHVLQPNFSRRRNTENTDSWSQSKLQKSKLWGLLCYWCFYGFFPALRKNKHFLRWRLHLVNLTEEKVLLE